MLKSYDENTTQEQVNKDLKSLWITLLNGMKKEMGEALKDKSNPDHREAIEEFDRYMLAKATIKAEHLLGGSLTEKQADELREILYFVITGGKDENMGE